MTARAPGSLGRAAGPHGRGAGRARRPGPGARRGVGGGPRRRGPRRAGGHHGRGHRAAGGARHVFRISSMTKPRRRGRGPGPRGGVPRCASTTRSTRYLPELADRRVLVRPDGRARRHRARGTADLAARRADVPARPRHGLHARPPQPVAGGDGRSGAGVGAAGARQGPRARRVDAGAWARCPSSTSPASAGCYHVGADVLGVLVARAAGQPLRRVPAGADLRARWAWSTPASRCPPAARDRFGPVLRRADAAGGVSVYDPTRRRAVGAPPAFPAGGDGLVSTIDDYLAFATMLRGGGEAPRRAAGSLSPAVGRG